MSTISSNDTGLAPFPFTDTNAYCFHIDDTEVSVLIDSGTKFVGSNIVDDVRLPLHSHPYYELFFVEQGTLRVSFQEKDVLLEKNDLIIIPPKTEHTTLRTENDTYRYTLNFHIKRNSIQINNSLLDAIDKICTPPYTLFQDCPLLQGTIKNLHRCVLNQQSMFVSLYFHEFIVRLLNFTPVLTDQAQKMPTYFETDIMRLQKISGIINGEFTSNITLEHIASYLNLSVRQTIRIIKEYYGMTFSELIIENKLRYATNLLIHSDLSTKEIACKTGYSSVKGFYHSFKKKYGCLPSEYRKANRIQNTQADSQKRK